MSPQAAASAAPARAGTAPITPSRRTRPGQPRIHSSAAATADVPPARTSTPRAIARALGTWLS
jgi:hypothetical protein